MKNYFKTVIGAIDPNSLVEHLENVLIFLQSDETELCFSNISSNMEILLLDIIQNKENLKCVELNDLTDGIPNVIYDILETTKDVIKLKTEFELDDTKRTLFYKKLFIVPSETSTSSLSQPERFKQLAKPPAKKKANKNAKKQDVQNEEVYKQPASPIFKKISMQTILDFINDKNKATLVYQENTYSESRFLTTIAKKAKSNKVNDPNIPENCQYLLRRMGASLKKAKDFNLNIREGKTDRATGLRDVTFIKVPNYSNINPPDFPIEIQETLDNSGDDLSQGLNVSAGSNVLPKTSKTDVPDLSALSINDSNQSDKFDCNKCYDQLPAPTWGQETPVITNSNISRTRSLSDRRKLSATRINFQATSTSDTAAGIDTEVSDINNPRGRSRQRTLDGRTSKLLEDMSTPIKSDKAMKMMQGMGWQGGALGAHGNGITEPIIPELGIPRKAGFGHKRPIKSQSKSRQPQQQPLPVPLLKQQPPSEPLLQLQPLPIALLQEQPLSVPSLQQQPQPVTFLQPQPPSEPLLQQQPLLEPLLQKRPKRVRLNVRGNQPKDMTNPFFKILFHFVASELTLRHIEYQYPLKKSEAGFLKRVTRLINKHYTLQYRIPDDLRPMLVKIQEKVQSNPDCRIDIKISPDLTEVVLFKLFDKNIDKRPKKAVVEKIYVQMSVFLETMEQLPAMVLRLVQTDDTEMTVDFDDSLTKGQCEFVDNIVKWINRKSGNMSYKGSMFSENIYNKIKESIGSAVLTTKFNEKSFIVIKKFKNTEINSEEKIGNNNQNIDNLNDSDRDVIVISDCESETNKYGAIPKIIDIKYYEPIKFGEEKESGAIADPDDFYKCITDLENVFENEPCDAKVKKETTEDIGWENATDIDFDYNAQLDWSSEETHSSPGNKRTLPQTDPMILKKVKFEPPMYKRVCITSNIEALNRERIKEIQTLIWNGIEDAKTLTLIKCHGFLNGALIYDCYDENSFDFLKNLFDVASDLSVEERNEDLLENYKMAMKINSFIDINVEKLFRNIELYNAGIWTDNWVFIKKSEYSNFIIITAIVDEKSFKYISDANFSLFAGIDKIQLSLIWD